MAKSRLRGGAKAHKKRVQKRNQELGAVKKQMEKKYTKMFEEQMKLLKEKMNQENQKTEEQSSESTTENNEPNS